MTKAIEYHISGLKCDVEGCGYTDDDAKFEDYPKYLNKPCPKCGANLLTEADLKATQALTSMADWVNALGIEASAGSEYMNVEVNMDGSGVPKFEVKP
jgi:hypothetical protein